MADRIITVTDPSVVTNDTLLGYNNYSDIDGQLGTTMTPTEATNGKTVTLSDGGVHEVTTKPVGTTNGEFSAVVSNAVSVSTGALSYNLVISAADEVTGDLSGLTNLVEDDYFEFKFRLPVALDRLNIFGCQAALADYIRIIEGTVSHPQVYPLDGAALVTGYVNHAADTWYTKRITRKADGGGLGFQTGLTPDFTLDTEQIRDNNADVYNLVYDILFATKITQGETSTTYSAAEIEYVKIKRGATIYVFDFNTPGAVQTSVPAGLTLTLAAEAGVTITDLFVSQ